MDFSMEELKGADFVIEEIESKVLLQLKKDLKSIGVETIIVNDFYKYIEKIKYKKTEKEKLDCLRFFLLDNYQHYKKEEKTALNNFFYNCGIALNKHFI
jgi:hypothetical protein